MSLAVAIRRIREGRKSPLSNRLPTRREHPRQSSAGVHQQTERPISEGSFDLDERPASPQCYPHRPNESNHFDMVGEQLLARLRTAENQGDPAMDFGAGTIGIDAGIRPVAL